MPYGYLDKEWKKLPEATRLSLQKKAHATWKLLHGWFNRTLKKYPYVPGFREEGFRVVKDK